MAVFATSHVAVDERACSYPARITVIQTGYLQMPVGQSVHPIARGAVLLGRNACFHVRIVIVFVDPDDDTGFEVKVGGDWIDISESTSRSNAMLNIA